MKKSEAQELRKILGEMELALGQIKHGEHGFAHTTLDIAASKLASMIVQSGK